jgi:hypothetical protein
MIIYAIFQLVSENIQVAVLCCALCLLFVGLAACRTCGFLHQNQRKNPDLGAPYGVCKEEFCAKSQNSLSNGLKPDKLLAIFSVTQYDKMFLKNQMTGAFSWLYIVSLSFAALL